MNAHLRCLVAVIAGSIWACGDDAGDGSVGASGRGGTSAALGGRQASAGSSGRSADGFFGGGGRMGATRMTCPMEEPANASACEPGRGNCMFGTRVCDCPSDTSTWVCWDPADCGTTVPAEQAACPVVGMTCSYGRDANCECSANGWDCGNQFCPAAEPAAASSCEGGDGECTYGTRMCDCDSMLWACWNVSDCPTAPPADASACQVDGMICPYAGGSCECEGADGWDCGRGVDNDPDAGTDADAGS
jgi:hypothetical protein